MALSRVRGRLSSTLAPFLFPLAVVGCLIAMGAIATFLVFAPDVRRVDPAALSELRAIGRVVGEDADTLHEWENTYVEFRYLVIHLDGGEEDLLAEAERRLGRTGWRVWNRVPPESHLESDHRPGLLVSAQPLLGAPLSGELWQEIAATELPMDRMAYVTVQP
ncbi:hypothetical protein [Nonomuraea rubra]|uniref:hypothetical protein n=1 Tax=Nonomuraea rubra TaxID=46180 RepID=UPI0033F32470